MGWGFLTSLLEEIHNHSTFVGKIWLTVFIVFRIVLTAVGGESIYSDEQSNFVCNTAQPGCENICYNTFSPLSHVRFWVFQIILVATPSLFYLGYAVNKIAHAEERADMKKPKKHLASRKQHGGIEGAEDNEEEGPVTYEMAEVESVGDGVSKGNHDDGKAKVKVRHDGRQRIKKDGLMPAYVVQLLARSCLEGAFLYGQYALFGVSVPDQYKCSDQPCPHTVDCFVSRPTEKTIFLIIMYTVSLLSLALNIMEMLHLGIGTIRDYMYSRLLHGQKALDEAALSRPHYSRYSFSRNAPAAPPSNSWPRIGNAPRCVNIVTYYPQKLENDSHIYSQPQIHSKPHFEYKQLQATRHTYSKRGQRQQQVNCTEWV